ncbi:MAG TPA: hypothetical protein VHC01_14875, partial [Gaiellaceae bacterium]|nr:hypothetical protein [Gaiellaceae bacterium]
MTETVDPFGPDWGDVLRRARRSRAHRWTLQAVVVAVLVVGVASAYAFGHSVIDFGSAKPAGLKQVDEFGSMQVGAPRGMAPGVLPHEARRITSVRFDGKVHTLYVAPTKSGGYCYVWTDLGGGCRARHDRVANALGTGGEVGPNGLTVLETSFLQAAGERLVMTFKDGATADVPFVWVSAPIDAGFTVYRIPDAHRRAATRPVWLALYDAHGKLLRRDPIRDTGLQPQRAVRLRGFGAVMVPQGGIWSQRKLLFDLRDPKGNRVYLFTMPKWGGGTCVTSNGEVGCVPGAWRGPLIQLGFSTDRLCCDVSAKVVRVEARFQDGARVSLYPKEGFLIWPIPASHWALGHRLVALVGYDAAGRVIAHGTVPKPADQRGIYPCKKPKNLGYGVKECV